jgi:hypothetical protein
MRTCHNKKGSADIALPLSRGGTSGGPDGRRLREFHTSCDAIGEQRWGGFPTYCPVNTPQRTHRQGASAGTRVRRILLDQCSRICARAQRGESLRALAANYGVSHETIRRILQILAPPAPRARRPFPPHGTRPHEEQPRNGRPAL